MNPAVLVKSIMGYQEKFVSTPAMKWGRDNEEKARRKYIQEREAVGEKMSVRETGLTLCPTMSYIGASADGYVTCHSVDTCCCGALEIKCPFSINNESVVHLTPQEIAERFGNKFCLGKGEDGTLRLRTSHMYYAQVQGEMAVMELEWCDFVVYSGDVVFVERIWFDLDYWFDILLPKLKSFYVHIAHEMLSGKYFMECYKCEHATTQTE